ncbi:MAG: FG-GAP-like repeat-containing protein [Candidatus Asgardarchaeia archaeon]
MIKAEAILLLLIVITATSYTYITSPTPAKINNTPSINSSAPIFTTTQTHAYLLWRCTTGSAVVSSPALGDVDGDGKLEVIIGSYDNNIYVLSGENGTCLWKYLTGDLVRSSPALGDVDGDGKLEVIIGSDDNNIYVLNGEDGTRLWKYATGSWVDSSPALGDVDGDGKPEVIIGSYDNNIYVLNGEDGTLLWKYSTGDLVWSSPALGDVDGDGKPEVIIGSDDNNIYALNGEDGTLLWKYSTGDLVRSSPALGDVDGDGKLEVIVGSGDTNIYALDVPDAGFRAYWSCFGGSNKHERNILYWDFDQDMLSDNSEIIIGTDPTSSDTDGDGMPDGWEVQCGLNPTYDDASQDADGDGFTNLQEYQRGTNPLVADANDFGIPMLWVVFIMIPILVFGVVKKRSVSRKRRGKTEVGNESKYVEVTQGNDFSEILMNLTNGTGVVSSKDIIHKVDKKQRREFALWLSDKLVAEGKHELAKDILVEVGEYEKAIPIIISIAMYYKVQGDIGKAKQMYRLVVELFKKLGDFENAKKVEEELKQL